MEGLELFLGSSESNVWQYGRWAAGPIRPSLPLCFSPAGVLQEDAGKFGAVQEGTQMESFKLVSRQFRKQRLAVWAAGRGPDPSFTAMVFWLCGGFL